MKLTKENLVHYGGLLGHLHHPNNHYSSTHANSKGYNFVLSQNFKGYNFSYIFQI